MCPSVFQIPIILLIRILLIFSFTSNSACTVLSLSKSAAAFENLLSNPYNNKTSM